MIEIKRAYDPPAPEDGARVLVDRLWPRGLRKFEARIDWWARALAPSAELRTWFGHDPEKYETFARRYRDELAGSEALDRLRALADAEETVTLVYAARDEAHNNARALRALLTS